VPEKFDARDDRNRNHLSAIQYLNADEQFSAVDRSMAVIVQSIGGLDRSRLKALEWSLNEITDNVLNPAESSVGGIVQVVHFAKRQLVEAPAGSRHHPFSTRVFTTSKCYLETVRKRIITG
jgi:hypothetical protein